MQKPHNIVSMSAINRSPNGYYYVTREDGSKMRVSQHATDRHHEELTYGTLNEIAKFVRQTEIVNGPPKRETCGILEKIDGNGRYKCIKTNNGEMSKTGRPMCVIHNQSDYIWHTHALNSKIFPSCEDIIIMFRRVVKKSFIFTMHGFWVIQKNCDKNFIIDKKSNMYNMLMIRLSSANDKLYRAKVTNSGKTYNANVFDKYAIDIRNIMSQKIKIKFYPLP